MDEHITYEVDEIQNYQEIDLNCFLIDFEKMQLHDDEVFVEIKNYDLNYNIKQLLVICDYYGISKNSIKINKMKKQDIIEQIMLFEKDSDNIEIVQKRKQMWYYMNELKNDKFMKKYILWV